MAGDKCINIIDLTELCAHFAPDTGVGREVHSMLDSYTQKNLRVRYNPQKLQFEKHTFLKLVAGEPCLAKELLFIFHGQFLSTNPYTGAV